MALSPHRSDLRRTEYRRVRTATELWHSRCPGSRAMNETSYRAAVVAFKRQLVETTLSAHGGNRTHAARALGLPRTYLLRLIRNLGVTTSSGRRISE
jgi:DNA-binding NtrC family response regulator